MKVKIWGARGSIPAPLGPEAVRQKIVSAFLGVSKVTGELREKLIPVILEDPSLTELEENEPDEDSQAGRRRIIETYLDSLSPLAATTASGNTPCIEIRSGNDLFIIDAGSGIRQLGRELMKGPWGHGEGVIHMFFSHPHWDHLQGFPFFRPAFIPGNKIFIYSVHDIEAALIRQQESISFPVPLEYLQATRIFTRLKEGEVKEFGDVRVRNIRNHHPGKAYGFRFEKGDKAFVYASDASYPDGIDLRPHLHFFADAEVVIFDAQFTQRESDEKQDWGHSSSFMGIEMAQQARVKNLVLFHYDPTYADEELEKILEDALTFQQNQYPTATPVNIMIAREGQTFDLTPVQKTQVQQMPGSRAAILKPVGIFDDHVAADLREQFTEMIETIEPAQIIVDMSGVEMLQVAGLRALVKLRNEQQGVPMALAGPSFNVQKLIELAGYLEFFAIYPSVHTALNALQARETLHLPGQILKGRYKIESKVGDGPLGAVFKATDTQTALAVAIKVLSASFSEGAIERFLRQGRQIIALDHPNIANVYDCEEDRGLSFMVEELIEGQTLRELLNDQAGQSLPVDLALGIAEKITVALEYAHAHGVVHGDLKPKNVMLADDIKITDFGLGRLESGRPLINIHVPLALVTAHYLAPEQILGHPIDARTDLYALGVILYEMFTGQPPFSGSDQEVVEQHLNKLPSPPRALNAHLSPSLEHLILKLLDKDPNKRYDQARRVRYILSSIALPASDELQRHIFSRTHWPTFVGRTEPLQHLRTLWEETQQGRGQVVFISGQSGLGKSRLAQELLDNLHEATILIGRCQRFEGNPAYHPFLSALKSYFENVRPDIADKNIGLVWQEIIELLPEIGKIVHGPIFSSIQDRPGQATPATLIEAIAQATAKRPWLLILDDLQWADIRSLRLLTLLAQHCSELALMIVALYEDEPAEPDTPLAEMLGLLSRQPNYTALSLEPFTEEEVRAFLESLWGQAVPADLVTTIYHRSQGHPLYVEILAWGLIDEGLVAWRDDKWYFGPVVEANLPQQVHEAVLRRTALLSREAQTLLNQAAVLGPLFSFEDLQSMSNLSFSASLEYIDIALERQLLKEAPGEKMLHFSHRAIQQVLYESLSPLKQRLLHREAAEALEQQHALEIREISPLLAFHFFQAGELEKGLTYSIQAATGANAIYTHQNALYWYSRALDVIDQLDETHSAQYQRFELLLARERIYNDLGLRQAQLVDLKALQELAQEMKEPAKQAQIHNRQSAYEYLMGHISEAATEAQAGLIAARQANNAVSESKSLIQLADIAMHQGQFDTARDHLLTAQTNLKKVSHQQAEARVLNSLGSLFRFLNNYIEAETCYQHALAVSQFTGDRVSQALYLSNLADLFLSKGAYAGARLHQQQALIINRIIGKRQGEAACLNRLAAIYKELGQYQAGLDYVNEAKALHTEIEDEQGLAEDLRLYGPLLGLSTGDYLAARDYTGQALEIFQRLKNKVQQLYTWLEFGWCLEQLNSFDKACHAYEQVQQLSSELGYQTANLDANAGVARCLFAEGKIEEAQQQIKNCLPALQSTSLFEVQYPVRLYLTVYRALRVVGQSQEASAMLQEGYTFLQHRLANIDNPGLRVSFFENVPENKELLEGWKNGRMEDR